MARAVEFWRRSLPIAAWPAADQAAWGHAFRVGDLLDDAGPAAHWRLATRALVAEAYGHWLGFLSATGRLDPTAELPPVWPDAIEAYVAALLAVNRRDTVIFRLSGLHAALRVMRSDTDLARVRGLLSGIRAQRAPGKPTKLARMQSADRLFRLGFEIMEEAAALAAARPCGWITRYRDGLLIALLAARPLRRASFASLRLGTSVVRSDDGWWLRVAGESTKTGARYEAPLPPGLTQAMDRYTDDLRQRLLAGRTDDHLWIQKDGRPMRPHAIYTRVTLLTHRYLGVAVNPHLFRDCAATSIAVLDPGHVRVAARVLGHATLATTEKHYNQAQALEAGRAHTAAIRAIRRATATAVGRTARGRQPGGR
jgi:integrase/recombinase XerD